MARLARDLGVCVYVCVCVRVCVLSSRPWRVLREVLPQDCDGILEERQRLLGWR